MVANVNQSLLTADKPTIDIDDVNFRMLEPSESKRAQAFETDYVILGTRREQQVMAGNAVPPPCGRDLVAAAVDSL